MEQNRDRRGRFTVGNSASKGYGRPMEHRKRTLQKAIDEEFPIDVVIGLLWEAIDMARAAPSYKGILAALEQIGELTDSHIELTPESDSVAEMIEQWRISKLAVIEDTEIGVENEHSHK